MTLETLAPLPGFPVPQGPELAEARSAAEKIEAKIRRARDPVVQASEIREALRAVQGTPLGSAPRYAILDRLRRLAIDAGALDAAILASDELSLYAGPDALDRRVGVLREAALKIADGERVPHVQKALQAVAAAASADRFAEAREALQTAIVSFRKTTAAPLHLKDAVDAWTDRLRRMQNSYAALPARPEGTAPSLSALAWGKHRCFACEDFERGLPLLAQGTDPLSASLAADDLENPAEPRAAFELGERWKKLAATLPPADRPAALHRAAVWFQASLAGQDERGRMATFKALDDVGLYCLPRVVRDRTAEHRGKRFMCVVDLAPWSEGDPWTLGLAGTSVPDADQWARARGGRLACIRDAAENAHVARLAVEPMRADQIHGAVWVGGDDVGAEGRWKWGDGSRFLYQNWGENEPNNFGGGAGEQYLALNIDRSRPERQGRWFDGTGSKACWFIVQWSRY